MVKLDKIDRRILDELQKDGGLSNQELADRIGLSPSPCSRRVKALTDAGVITRRTTLLDRKSLGLNLAAILHISMDKHTPERFENFEAHVKRYPEVQQCLLVTGQEADYVLQVSVPDIDYYQHFLLDRVTRIDGVSGVHSSFVMRRIVDTTALPLL
jgi:Lrp/AsnC family leucine-responsive transcriptional regulator